MAKGRGQDVDAITGETIKGVEIPNHGGKAGNTGEPQNAFAFLMSQKPHPTPAEPKNRPWEDKKFYGGRDGLKAYTVEPEAFGSDRIISFDDKFVHIWDMFPKAAVHTLVLTRDFSKDELHPFDAFEDPVFLEETKVAVDKAKQVVASELRRRFGRYSASEQARIAAMEADEIPDELPEGRDWLKEVKAGIHAHPSMTHLHVHVMSVDNTGDCLSHAKHYESFNTGFLVPLEAFPLGPDDPRRHPGSNGIINQDLKCWRCGRNFGRKFKALKEHLSEEFETWKRE
ncbi:Aprataxin-like protein [Sphaceloma murrayae]|uniref:Aprataxin-like protein n=1 Tax=Sphaceloma murrayae TaxID=2082308 RepID=A0A2K1QWW6_9PEZI|nr:Aprataxin-like protein [Sphaceloma murrayae]